MENAVPLRRTLKKGVSESLLKALAILDCYLEGSGEWGVSKLSRRLHMHKSRVHRALKTFEMASYLRSDPLTGKYRLGLKLFELGKVVERDLRWREEVRPDLIDLSLNTEATVLLRVLHGFGNVVVEAVESPGPLRLSQPVGTRSHAAFGAGGKLLLAYLPEPALSEVLDSIKLPAFTPKTITSKTRLRKEMKVIRRQGFAFSDEEAIPHIRGLAVPIFGTGEKALCAIVLGLPTPQCPKERLPELLRAMRSTAEKISRVIAPLGKEFLPFEADGPPLRSRH